MEDKINSMTVALHLGIIKKMNYALKEYYKYNWVSYRAWIVLHAYPKWMEGNNRIMIESSSATAATNLNHCTTDEALVFNDGSTTVPSSG